MTAWPGMSLWSPRRARSKKVERSVDLGQGSQVELDDLRVVQQLLASAGVCVGALIKHIPTITYLETATGVLLHHDHTHPGTVDLPGADEDLILKSG